MAQLGSCVYNVPMAFDLDLTRTAGLEPLLSFARNRNHVYEAQKYTVGPMPAGFFIDNFLPRTIPDKRALLSPRNAFIGVPSRAESFAQIYEPLTSALNKRTKIKSRCPGFVFMPTFEHSIRPLRLGYAKPHICCLRSENLAHVQQAHPSSRVELGYAELFIQVAADPTDDLLVDPPNGTPMESFADHEFVRNFMKFDGEFTERKFRKLEAQQKAVVRAHGLHAAFAVEVFARQQRHFLYTISIAGSMARIYRWDRSGCVVTTAFDIRQKPEILAEFLWRFSNLSAPARGHDLTVRMATAAEEALFKRVVRDYLASQVEATGDQLDKAFSAHYQPGHVAAVRVTPDMSKMAGEATYIVSRPVHSPLALDGRSTRGYWAVNADTGQIGFLKDTWRTVSQQETEGDILHRLNELGVRNVPILAIHGDVPDPRMSSISGPLFQDTHTNRFIGTPWSSRLNGKTIYVSRRRHYRLVTHTVGQSLRTLRGTEELLHSTYDVFVAMRDVLAKDSRIHRDLSVGNIILVKESDRAIRKGYLIDWDSSDRVDDAGESLHTGRAGTWAFTSIRMLGSAFENGKQIFKDDMESLIYVVFYCAVFYLSHDLDAAQLTRLNKEFFEHRQMAGNTTFGAKGKVANARSRCFTGSVHFSSAAFREWLNAVLDYHSPKKGVVGNGEMWEAEILDRYWSQFLQTHTLERDDRTVHHLNMEHRYDPDSPRSEPVPSLPSPHRSPLPLDKAPSGADTAGAGRRRKRSRGEDADPGVSSSRLKRVHEDDPSVPLLLTLRRSQRIREQQSRLQVAPAPASSTHSTRQKHAVGARAPAASAKRSRK
ncbi:hypothetical protein PYCCODRAFT_1419696 [Trametes coccinea BRFM310]|uniref:Fungal-type protein kinase domain-containing protein n=1 Tax=Trametes coccinea (strain BRFM310) TaxID=1353009 RepID=A0A1Y2IAA9_TRAC3|nr:hypothetical protein PYCCODRAFT_1419696 [Trametes coccinea BRFM310]